MAKKLSCSEDPTQLVCGGRETELSQKQIEIIQRVLQFLKEGVLINSKGGGGGEVNAPSKRSHAVGQG